MAMQQKLKTLVLADWLRRSTLQFGNSTQVE